MNVARHRLAHAAALAAAALAAPAAVADPVPLTDLIASRTPMDCGGVRIVFLSFNSHAFDPANVMVSIVDRGADGQGFRLANNWRDHVPGDPWTSDFTINFTAESMTGAPIVGDRVWMEGAAAMEGSFVRFNDHAYNGDPDPLISRTLAVDSADGPGPHSRELRHTYGPAGQGSLEFSQDGWLFAASPGGSATASAFERTFIMDEAGIVVPVASPALLALPFLGAAAATRRRRPHHHPHHPA